MFFEVPSVYPIVGWLVKLFSSIQRFFMSRPPHRGSTPFVTTSPALLCQADLAIALGNINKAIILQKVYEWCCLNEAKRSRAHRRDGYYWTYNSYEEWQSDHFGWLNVDTVRRLFKELEKDGLIVAAQYGVFKGDYRKWYRVNEAALRARLKGMGKSSGRVIPMPASGGQAVQKAAPNARQQIKSSSLSNDNPQENAAVSPLPLVSAAREEASTGTKTPTPLTAFEAWRLAAVQLAAIDKVFAAWLEGAQCVGYEDGVYTVAVSSAYVAQALGRYQRRVLKTAQNLYPAATAIRFISLVRAQSA